MPLTLATMAFLSLATCGKAPLPDVLKISDAVHSSAEIFNLPELLLVAQAESESGCKINAVSNVKKDFGVLQVRLKTAQSIAPTIKKKDLFDPYLNVLVASHYLSDNIKKCGSVSKGLGAYSSGHCQVNSYSRKVMGKYLKLKKVYLNG